MRRLVRGESKPKFALLKATHLTSNKFHRLNLPEIGCHIKRYFLFIPQANKRRTLSRRTPPHSQERKAITEGMNLGSPHSFISAVGEGGRFPLKPRRQEIRTQGSGNDGNERTRPDVESATYKRGTRGSWAVNSICTVGPWSTTFVQF